MMVGSRGNGGAREMAEALRRMGRRGDTMLAHITPEEADMLAEMGGAGTINPDTGLPEFYNGFDFDVPDMGEPPDFTVQEYNRMTAAPPAARGRDFQRDEAMGFDSGASSYRGVNVPTDIFAPRRSDTISTDYLRDTNLRGGGEFEQIPQLRQQPVPQGRLYSNVDFTNFPLPELRGLQDAAIDRSSEPGFASRAEGRLKELQDVLNQYPNLTRAGTAGANILAQALLFNQANRAMRRDIDETRRGAQPFRAAQQEAMGRATGAGLTPEQEQDMEIAQARARQGLGERGMQTGSAASGILAAQQRRARSMARQESFSEALRLANIADQYDRRALEMELARDQQLAQLFAGIVGREVQQAQRTEAPAPQQQR